MKKGTIRISAILFSILVFQSNMIAGGDSNKNTRKDYINQWKEVAIRNMQAHGIPASITLAQGILESGDGNSTLALRANNHFGIKCHDWDGQKVYHDDDKKGECFRKYDDASASFEDHSQFLQRSRYADLFKLKTTDYKGWAKGLKKAGYATDPKYAARLIKIIEQNKLYKFDSDNANYIAEASPSTAKSHKNKSQSEEISVDLGSQRVVHTHPSSIKYVLAKDMERVHDVAMEFNMADWQIIKYNDLSQGRKFKEGEIIYLQPKRNKSSKGYYITQQGESLRDVSQTTGVKLNRIYRYNGLSPGDEVPPNSKVWLKKQ